MFFLIDTQQQNFPAFFSLTEALFYVQKTAFGLLVLSLAVSVCLVRLLRAGFGRQSRWLIGA